jgi:hypothetical protein
MGDPNVPLSKEGPYAFLPENDIRIEKRLLYERASQYLASSGFQMADPELILNSAVEGVVQGVEGATLARS